MYGELKNTEDEVKLAEVVRRSGGWLTIAGIVVALDILGVTALLSTILGAAGIAGLAIGFAVRDTVENFIASVLLSMRQPFRPNDVVEIEGDIGKVIGNVSDDMVEAFVTSRRNISTRS